MSQSNGNSLLREFTKGFIRENPILVIMLGLCATLACSAVNTRFVKRAIATISAWSTSGSPALPKKISITTRGQ